MAEESGGQMRGIWYSEDHGQNWYKIAPASTFGWTPCISANGQCYYDMVIDAVPGHPDHCIFGGIDLYRWEKTEGTSASDADGQWEQISLWNANQNSPVYVHADNHLGLHGTLMALYMLGTMEECLSPLRTATSILYCHKQRIQCYAILRYWLWAKWRNHRGCSRQRYSL